MNTISDSIEGESGGLKRSRQDISALDHQCLPPRIPKRSPSPWADLSGKICDKKFISTLHKNHTFVRRLQNCVEWYGPFGQWHSSFNRAKRKGKKTSHLKKRFLRHLINKINKYISQLLFDKNIETRFVR